MFSRLRGVRLDGRFFWRSTASARRTATKIGSPIHLTSSFIGRGRLPASQRPLEAAIRVESAFGSRGKLESSAETVLCGAAAFENTKELQNEGSADTLSSRWLSGNER
jgi:hypothetical protein